MTRQPPPGMDETIAAEVEGRTPAPEPHLRVKPLEWYQDPGSFPYKTWGAQSSFGRFIIEEVTASDSAAYEARYTPHHLITVTDGLPEAQEACQSDFERRIRAALAAEGPQQ